MHISWAISKGLCMDL